MDAFGVCTSSLIAWAHRAIASAKTWRYQRLRQGAAPSTTLDTSRALSTTRSSAGRRRRVDALYALGLLASIAGFALVGNDVVALQNGPHKKVAPRLANNTARPGSFPAPPEAKAWAEAIAGCVRPGPKVQQFVESFQGTPSQRIAQIYIWIAQHLQYDADRGDQDWLTPAETLLEPGMLHGDCKAIAILLAASSTQIGIANRLVATRGMNGSAGHVQTQILLCRPGEDPTPVVDHMTALWNSLGHITDDGKADLPLVLTTQGWYLALDGGPPPRRTDRLGPVEVIVSSASRTDK